MILSILLSFYMYIVILLSVYMYIVWQTSVIPTQTDLDPDVLTTMNSLQCFKDKDQLKGELLSDK